MNCHPDSQVAATGTMGDSNVWRRPLNAVYFCLVAASCVIDLVGRYPAKVHLARLVDGYLLVHRNPEQWQGYVCELMRAKVRLVDAFLLV